MYKNSKINLQRLFLSLESMSTLTSISHWIKNKSTIVIKSRRGVTEQMLIDLRVGKRDDRIETFVELMATGDAAKVIPKAAKEFAKEARNTALHRLH